MIELYLLSIAMLAAAIVAIEIKDLLAAAVAVGIVGFSVAIMFILVQAPDLAIVQIVVEVLTVVFFASTILRTTHTDTTIGKGIKTESIFPVVTFFIFATLFLVLAIYAMNDLPVFGSPVMKVADTYIANGLRETGAANIVAAIILDYRGYDTFGEAVVLFTSVLGVLSIMRAKGKQ